MEDFVINSLSQLIPMLIMWIITRIVDKSKNDRHADDSHNA